MMRAIICCALLLAACAHAAVVDSSASGFTVKITIPIQAPPATVYQKFMKNVGEWWNPAHTFSGNAKNLSIEERVMGCFCEKLADGGAVRHMQVVYLVPGKGVVLSGTLGPMETLAAMGTMRITFTPEEGGTKLEATYAVAGYLAAGMNTFAGPVDGVLSEQFARLKKYVEGGDLAAK